jgi:hypothetical protein
VPIPPNGAEAQSRNVVFNLKINPDPEAWATGTNCEMNAQARADSQPRWIQYVPYTGSEPWTSWKIIDFKITLGDTVVWTGQSAMDEGAPRIIKAIRYASNHFPNGKATFKVSARFVFYLEATTQVRVYNQVFAWSTWWTAEGICAEPGLSFNQVDFKLNTQGQWVPADASARVQIAKNDALVKEKACREIVGAMVTAKYGALPVGTGQTSPFLFSRSSAGGTPDSGLMQIEFDTGMKLATTFVSLSHGYSTPSNNKGLVTSKHNELIAPEGLPVSLEQLVSSRGQGATALAPRPSLALLYTCYGAEDETYLGPLQIRLGSELFAPDRALAGFPSQIAVTQYKIDPAGGPVTFQGTVDQRLVASRHAQLLMKNLLDGMTLDDAAASADFDCPQKTPSLASTSMVILGDPWFRLRDVYFYPVEMSDPLYMDYFYSWYLPL